MSRWIPLSLALLGGALLAIMVALNGQLYHYVTPIESSWIAHGTGAIAALLVLFFNNYRGKSVAAAQKAPWWAYLGGLSGGLLVVIAVITVNSFLGVTGTLVLSILGQILFGMLSDQQGWFGLQAHRISKQKLLSILPIAIGAFLIVYAKGAMT